MLELIKKVVELLMQWLKTKEVETKVDAKAAEAKLEHIEHNNEVKEDLQNARQEVADRVADVTRTSELPDDGFKRRD